MESLIRSPISPARPLPTVNVNEDVEMVPAEDRQRVREVLARVNIPDAVELASSSSGLASMKQPIVNNNHIVAAPQNNNQHRVCRQTVLSGEIVFHETSFTRENCFVILRSTKKLSCCVQSKVFGMTNYEVFLSREQDLIRSFVLSPGSLFEVGIVLRVFCCLASAVTLGHGRKNSCVSGVVPRNFKKGLVLASMPSFIKKLGLAYLAST
jgi:hypothetical protein